MIVTCPSCDSKYQVADDKVAGSMLRTRCKACGSPIVVDGTQPPPAGDANVNEDDLRPLDSAPAHASTAPSRSKPPPPQRTSMAAGAPVNSKPPPPQRRSQTPSPGAGGSISKRPVVDVNAPDALDPNASSSDFYSKLLSKVGTPKTKSQPAPAPDATFNPKKTYPPPREPFPLATDRGGSRPAPARSDGPHAGLSPQAEGEVATGDFYAKILAKVRPQKSEPPAAQAATAQTSQQKTLPPPSWGALPQAQPADTNAAAPAGIAPAPIRGLQQAPGAPAPFNPKATAIGLGEFEVHVDIPVDVPPAPEAAEKVAPGTAARLSPVPPKRSDPPPLAASIQLPPITGATTDARPPAGIVIPGLTPAVNAPPAAAGAATATAPTSTAPTGTTPSASSEASSKPDPTLKPSVKSMSGAPATASLDPYVARTQPKRFAGMIFAVIGVGLLGVGGGVAATIYALKPTLNAAQAPAASTPVAVAATPSAAPVQSHQPVTPPAQSQAAASPEPPQSGNESGEKSAASSEKAAPKSAHVTSQGSRAAAPAEPRSVAKAAAEPAFPAPLEAKGAGKTTSTKTVLPPAPTPAAPSKGGGSGPFPKEVAQAMLGVAASQAPSCKKPGGPTGTGKAIVTFDTDGQVVITNIVGEGFAGTPTGQCVAALFRRVRVPPFAGDRSTATKVFNIPP